MAKAAAGATPATKTAPAAKKTSTAVAPVEKKSTALAVPAVNMEEDAGGGFEHANKDSFAIPFLTILQSGSPQCKKSEGAYIKGAEEGMFLNTVTQAVFEGSDEGVLLIPCAYTMTYVEWAPRESKGGFKGEHNVAVGQSLMATTRKDDKNRDILPNGNQLNQTHNMYMLLITEDGPPQPLIASFVSTQIKKCKRWMTMMNQLRLKKVDGTPYQPPMFSHVYRATTIPESNDQGSWMGWDIEIDRPLDITTADDANLYLEARKFKESIVKGEVKVSSRDAEAGAAGEPGGQTYEHADDGEM